MASMLMRAAGAGLLVSLLAGCGAEPETAAAPEALASAAADTLLAIDPAEASLAEGRRLLFTEEPRLLGRIAEGGAFGGVWSRPAAVAMLSRDPAITEDVRAKTTVEEAAPGLWLIRLPIVNVIAVETEDSLVLIDAGYASAGPVLVETLRGLSDKPLSHILITHHHLDHAWGVWALKEAWPEAVVVGEERLAANLRLYVTQAGRLARYNNQAPEFYPTDVADTPQPDLTFRGRLDLEIGGVRFELIAAEGETDDQFFVWLPRWSAIVVADYFQGFLPNAGNGKRMQRHLPEWAGALRAMAALEPELMLPMHGPAMADPAEIDRVLNLHADALEHVTEHVREGLNTGLRKDQIAESLDWPEPFASDPTLTTPYVRPRDLARMEARRWSGWWDDIPSHFDRPLFEEQAREIVRLAGGVEALDARARELAASNPRLALQLADWAVYAEPRSERANRLVLDLYLGRILGEDIPTQEMVVYLEAAAMARARLALAEQSGAAAGQREAE